jgi:hypothetical protein
MHLRSLTRSDFETEKERPMKIFRIVALTIALVLAGAGYAQDIETDYFARYEDIPQSRAEDGAFVLGDPDAPVTIVEFADFMCPHCQNYQVTVHDFIEQYVTTGQARFEYRFYPIVHPTYSVFTAQIAECAEVQRDGAFWASHDLLYDLAADGLIGPTTPEDVAETLGLNAEKIETCLETATQHEVDTQLGESLGVNGTPATTVRLSDRTLGWAYLREQIWNRGGLPMNYLTEIIEAEDHAEIVVVPRPLLSDLVTESACEAPCWRDIVPGETLIAEVADLIRADKQNVEISVQDIENGAQAVTWKTFNTELDDPNYVVGNPEGTVEAISLLDLSQYTLGDVIATQGEPDFALAVPNNEDSALFYAIYEGKALLVLGLIITEDGLTEETSIVGAQYYAPSAMEELLSNAAAPAWTGYDSLADYIRE